MRGVKENNIKRELEFKEWREFLQSVNDDLNRINNILLACYEDRSNIKRFSNVLNTFVISKNAYIQSKELKKVLDDIENKLYDRVFQDDLKAGKKTAIDFEFKLFKQLKRCYARVVNEISACQLIPKTVEVDLDTPFAVRQ